MPLRTLHISKCKPGMIVGEDIVDDAGQVLAERGDRLMKDAIAILAEQGYMQVCVNLPETYAKEQESVDPEFIEKGEAALRKRGVPPKDRVPTLRQQAQADLVKTCNAPMVQALFGRKKNLKELVIQYIANEFQPKILAGLIGIKIMNSS